MNEQTPKHDLLSVRELRRQGYADTHPMIQRQLSEGSAAGKSEVASNDSVSERISNATTEELAEVGRAALDRIHAPYVVEKGTVLLPSEYGDVLSGDRSK